MTNQMQNQPSRLKDSIILFGVPCWLIVISIFAPSGTVTLASLFALMAGAALGIAGRRMAPEFGSLASWTRGSWINKLIFLLTVMLVGAAAFYAFGGINGMVDFVENIDGLPSELITGSGEMNDPGQLVSDLGRSLGDKRVYAQLVSLGAMVISALGGFFIGRWALRS